MKKNTEDLTLADNVLAFLDRASRGVGQAAEEYFNQDLFSQCIELGMESPIEHLFFIAVAAQCAVRNTEVNPHPRRDESGNLIWRAGIYIRPQVDIGKYRVDFLVSMRGFAPEEIYTPVIVELDGHAFHDKDAKQRSYEKARDRFFVKKGYRLVHYTGSDVVRDPHRVAVEVLDMLALYHGMGFHDDDGALNYDPNDPFFLGWA